MRVISQDGMIDAPYEQMIINIDYRNKKNIVANGVNCSDNTLFTVAEYSTEERAGRAMEMLRNEYHGYKVEETYQEGTEYYHPIFQFPKDNELESGMK